MSPSPTFVLGDEGRSGIDLVEALRTRDIGVPVLLITAFAHRDMVLRALDAGAAFLLENPFGMAELTSALQTVMSSRSDTLVRVVDRSLAQARLTKKEEQIARLTLRGMTIAQVAAATGNAEATVRQHLGQVYAKLGVSTGAEFFHLVFQVDFFESGTPVKSPARRRPSRFVGGSRVHPANSSSSLAQSSSAPTRALSGGCRERLHRLAFVPGRREDAL
jgi:DNA-binding NarL/FixJ family response regulator